MKASQHFSRAAGSSLLPMAGDCHASSCCSFFPISRTFFLLSLSPHCLLPETPSVWEPSTTLPYFLPPALSRNIIRRTVSVARPNAVLPTLSLSGVLPSSNFPLLWLSSLPSSPAPPTHIHLRFVDQVSLFLSSHQPQLIFPRMFKTVANACFTSRSPKHAFLSPNGNENLLRDLVMSNCLKSQL